MGQIIHEKQDLRYLEWSKIRNSSGTAGSFLKSSEEIGGKKIYYKLSDYDPIQGIVGHECVNEIIVDRLLTILGIEHLEYDLIHADIHINGKDIETYLCASNDFKEPREQKMALDSYYENEREESETPLDFCIRNGWENYIYQMFVIDFLILNRDRHGANIEVLQNPQQKSIRLAPLFDHGLSLLCRCFSDAEIEKFDVLENKRVQGFVGGGYAQDNLELIPKAKLPVFKELQRKDRRILFEGLENILPEKHLDKIWDMLWKRWCYYEDFCNSK